MKITYTSSLSYFSFFSPLQYRHCTPVLHSPLNRKKNVVVFSLVYKVSIHIFKQEKGKDKF